MAADAKDVTHSKDTCSAKDHHVKYWPRKLIDLVERSKFLLSIAALVVLLVLLCAFALTSNSTLFISNPLALWSNDVFSGNEVLSKYNLDVTSRQADVSVVQFLSASPSPHSPISTSSSSSAFSGNSAADAEADHSDTILTSNQLLAHLHLIKQMLHTTVKYRGIEWEYSSICSKVAFPYYQSSHYSHQMVNQLMNNFNPCLITTPLDCFWDGASLLDATTKPLSLRSPGSSRSDLLSDNFFPLFGNEPLMWRNADLRKNVTRMRSLWTTESMLDFVMGLIERYGIGSMSYIRKPCLDKSNCRPYSKEVKSHEEIAGAFSKFAHLHSDVSSSHSSCPSFAPKLHNSSLDIILGYTSRTSDGRVVSARQLQTVVHIMDGVQFFNAMDPQMKSFHVSWDLEAANQVLSLFYNKFQKIVESFNDVRLTTNLDKQKAQSGDAKFLIFSVRQLDYEKLWLLSRAQLGFNLFCAFVIFLTLSLSHTFAFKTKYPIVCCVSTFVFSTSFVAMVAVFLYVINTKIFSFPATSSEVLQMGFVIVIPLTSVINQLEQLVLTKCFKCWRMILCWPLLHAIVSSLVPFVLFLYFYQVQAKMTLRVPRVRIKK